MLLFDATVLIWLSKNSLVQYVTHKITFIMSSSVGGENAWVKYGLLRLGGSNEWTGE